MAVWPRCSGRWTRALGRELAVKVLLERHKERTDLTDRFLEEVQISCQLQHPGVVPIHELGRSTTAVPILP